MIGMRWSPAVSAQVQQDGGKRTLQELLRDNMAGFDGFECSVKLASVLNSDGSFARLLRVGRQAQGGCGHAQPTLLTRACSR